MFRKSVSCCYETSNGPLEKSSALEKSVAPLGLSLISYSFYIMKTLHFFQRLGGIMQLRETVLAAKRKNCLSSGEIPAGPEGWNDTILEVREFQL